jgi:ferredoxin
MSSQTDSAQVIDATGLNQLLGSLGRQGYRVLGPTVRDGAIAYDDIASLEDLPRGWTDEQAPGHYRLKRRSDEALFGYAVGAHSYKQFFHPPWETLWHARRENETLQVHGEPSPARRLALIGVRACEIRAIAIQDRVLMERDPLYRARRADTFIAALNCTTPGGTCFCASMDAGPQVTTGFDLALTELSSADPPVFVVRAATRAGREALAAIEHHGATEAHIAAAAAAVRSAALHMGRQMPNADLPQLLLANLEHPRWNALAERCLACGNCTLVCPTCFCTTVEDTSDLAGRQISRGRRWDSCFTADFSYVHGGSVRASTRARYRQWMTHKLATWPQQFGTSGCVGCGRCITWCPVGIDITEELAALRGGATL